jgi:hypothetical protein
MILMNRRDPETQKKLAERGSVSRSAQHCSEVLRVTDPRSNIELKFSALRLCASAV